MLAVVAAAAAMLLMMTEPTKASDISTRIIDGVTSSISDYPYFVQLSMGCGGSLIAPTYGQSPPHLTLPRPQ